MGKKPVSEPKKDTPESTPPPKKETPPGTTMEVKPASLLPVVVKTPADDKVTIVPNRRKKMYRDDGSFNQDMFFELIGNDIRRKILTKLAKFPRYASDLAIDLNVSKQAVKKHVTKLLEFGLVEEVPLERSGQKIQFYQIASDLAIFGTYDLTPNYFHFDIVNSPDRLAEGLAKLQHNPQTALITPQQGGNTNYHDLNFALGRLGQQLNQAESKITRIENERNDALMEKTVILNQIQFIINALVETDLEKEVIFSLFYDLKASIEGITVMDIVNQLFLRKRKRAGVGEFKYDKPDERTLQRGKDLLELLRALVQNFGFIRTEGNELFFDFKEDL